MAQENLAELIRGDIETLIATPERVPLFANWTRAVSSRAQRILGFKADRHYTTANFATQPNESCIVFDSHRDEGGKLFSRWVLRSVGDKVEIADRIQLFPNRSDILHGFEYSFQGNGNKVLKAVSVSVSNPHRDTGYVASLPEEIFHFGKGWKNSTCFGFPFLHDVGAESQMSFNPDDRSERQIQLKIKAAQKKSPWARLFDTLPHVTHQHDFEPVPICLTPENVARLIGDRVVKTMERTPGF